MHIIESCLAQARSACKRLVLPEGNDERIVRVARRLKDDGIALPILLGGPDELREAAQRAGVSLDGITVIDPERSDRVGAYGERQAMKGLRAEEGLSARAGELDARVEEGAEVKRLIAVSAVQSAASTVQASPVRAEQ